jgi:hypothetical protein
VEKSSQKLCYLIKDAVIPSFISKSVLILHTEIILNRYLLYIQCHLVKYMSTFSQRLDKFVFSVTIILFASTIWISSVSALPQQQTSLGVKITNPVKGQQVSIHIITCDLCNTREAEYDVFIDGVIEEIPVSKRCCDNCLDSI